MRISIDGGALCAVKSDRFGNYIFSRDLIEAMGKYDKKNKYIIYTFCQPSPQVKPIDNIRLKIIQPSLFWSSLRLGAEQLISPSPVFLALNQAIPYFHPNKVISFCHGLSYYFHRQYYSTSYPRLKYQLDRLVKKSNHIIVSSIKVKEELISMYRCIENVSVLNFGIPFDMSDAIKNKSCQKKDNFFIYAGMNHPIKNIDFIVNAFKQFNKDNSNNGYKLYLIGNFNENSFKNKNIHIFKNISRSNLKRLYQKAACYLTASYYESFNLPVLEALSQNCPVIGLKSAIIPEFRQYVQLVDKYDEFVETMKVLARGRRNIPDQKRLKSKFSWEKYIKKLTALY